MKRREIKDLQDDREAKEIGTETLPSYVIQDDKSDETYGGTCAPERSIPRGLSMSGIFSSPQRETAAGNINLLMDAVALTATPFTNIVCELARTLIRKTGGLLPTFEVQRVRKGQDYVERLVARWTLRRIIKGVELSGIEQACEEAYRRDIRGHNKHGKGWEEVFKAQDLKSKSIPGKLGIYFGPHMYFSSSATGATATRKFGSAAEARYLLKEWPNDWIGRSGRKVLKPISTEIEVREGFTDRENPGLPQEDFLQFVIQISYLLATQELIHRPTLMAMIYKALSLIGIAHISRDQLYGMQEAVEEIERVLLLPFEYPDAATAYQYESESVLVVGVPGVGKTFLEHYLMTNGLYNVLFATVDALRLRQDLVKETGSPILLHIDRIKSDTHLPIILIIDDIEGLLAGGEHNVDMVVKFLNMMQGIQQRGLYFIASTNKPQGLDARLLEPGRFTSIVHAPIPASQEERGGILGAHLPEDLFRSKEEREEILEYAAGETEGWTHRFLKQLCQEAGRFCTLEITRDGDKSHDYWMVANARSPREIPSYFPLALAHFQQAFEVVRQKIDIEHLRKWDKSIQNFVSHNRSQAGY